MQHVWMSRLSCVFPEAFWCDCDLLENLQVCSDVSTLSFSAGLTCARQVCGDLNRGWSGPWLDLRLKSCMLAR